MVIGIQQEMSAVPRLLKPAEAAELLGVSEKWLTRDRWAERRLPYVKFGRSVRYRAADISAFIEANTQPAVQ